MLKHLLLLILCIIYFIVIIIIARNQLHTSTLTCIHIICTIISFFFSTFYVPLNHWKNKEYRAKIYTLLLLLLLLLHYTHTVYTKVCIRGNFMHLILDLLCEPENLFRIFSLVFPLLSKIENYLYYNFLSSPTLFFFLLFPFRKKNEE